MSKKVLVVMVLALMAMAGSWTRAAARPLPGDGSHAEEPASTGPVRTVLPGPTSQWRGHMLLSFEKKTMAGASCGPGSTHDKNNAPCPPSR
ncbi:hypothetical protein ZWY2020_022335 [Hordeum vulgare]|nr:hypothetical protein ZWY2020_022335 [Hordeum vulgare]